MSNSVMIMGPSGSGKSTSIESLNPAETFVIKTKDKPLPFRGSSKKYFKGDKENGLAGNLYILNSKHPSERFKQLLTVLDGIDKRLPEIKSIVIDDFQYLMVDEYMSRVSEKGWEKFGEMAYHMWKIFESLNSYRDDLDIFILSHSEVVDDGRSTIKLIGNMIRKNVEPEGLFTVVLHTTAEEGQYNFQTQLKRIGGVLLSAKSPRGMFEHQEVENDLQMIKQKMKIYFDDEKEETFEKPQISKDIAA